MILFIEAAADAAIISSEGRFFAPLFIDIFIISFFAFGFRFLSAAAL